MVWDRRDCDVFLASVSAREQVPEFEVQSVIFLLPSFVFVVPGAFSLCARRRPFERHIPKQEDQGICDFCWNFVATAVVIGVGRANSAIAVIVSLVVLAVVAPFQGQRMLLPLLLLMLVLPNITTVPASTGAARNESDVNVFFVSPMFGCPFDLKQRNSRLKSWTNSDFHHFCS